MESFFWERAACAAMDRAKYENKRLQIDSDGNVGEIVLAKNM